MEENTQDEYLDLDERQGSVPKELDFPEVFGDLDIGL